MYETKFLPLLKGVEGGVLIKVTIKLKQKNVHKNFILADKFVSPGNMC